MKIYSVTEFNHEIKDMMSDMKVVVQGEVSGFRVNQGRLIFFDLKDGSSALPCFLLAFNLKEKIEDGAEIRVTGNPSLFIKSGKFNFNVQDIELVGKGSLQREFERLKKKLGEEGLFREERKRALPRFPERIGLITSLDAAAYTDVLRILNTRWSGLEIMVFPVRVQGKDAIGDIVNAFQYFKENRDAEVIILTRGGGSLEDLQGFNSEEVARAVFSSPIPVVCGVGHERDISLADFVADVRAATPTHAAELVVPHRDDVRYQIGELMKHQTREIENSITEISGSIDQNLSRLEHAVFEEIHRVEQANQKFLMQSEQWFQKIEFYQEKISHQKQRIIAGMENSMIKTTNRAETFFGLLHTLNPKNIIERGYSITIDEKSRVIQSIYDTHAGERIITKLKDGSITSKIE